MSDASTPKPRVYAGLFFVTLATLMHQILLTRIFSVTMWYHFAFIAISVAMFGMTVGAVIVYLRPTVYTTATAVPKLASNALVYAISMVVAFLIYIQIPFTGESDPTSIVYLVLSYVVIAVPFTFSGICVAIALTKFPNHVAKLYAADLVGAALGCVMLIFVLEITDAPTAVMVVAVFASIGALLFAQAEPDAKALRTRSMIAVAVLGVAATGNTILANQQKGLIQIREAGIQGESNNHWVKWNSFSRVNVGGNPFEPMNAVGWGLSDKTGAQKARIRQMHMAVDTWAGTVITNFDGRDTGPLWFLKDDVTNMAHHIRRDADVLVVGVGGGRDVLSALVFDQKSVTGVEINPNMLRAINEVYADFAGHLDQHPKVRFEIDEARSYVARSKDKYDILQISLIDTWAATAAGAFVLTESALYTTEGWVTFLEHLDERGILTVSRWYYPTRPGEAYRLASLATESLQRIGVENPRDHVAMVVMPKAQGLSGAIGNGIVTCLVSRDPFSKEDIEKLWRESIRLGFQMPLTPTTSESPVFDRILSGRDLEPFYASFPIDITAPTDDKPFFFQMLRLRDFAQSLDAHAFDPNRHNVLAIRLLGILLVIVLVLTSLCVFVPLGLSRKKIPLKGSGPLLLFFLCIGLGFMFVEISQMQRLMVFLGHPTYALGVVLFTLLVGTGIGSSLSDRVVPEGVENRPYVVLLALLVVLVIFGSATPVLIEAFSASTTFVRVSVAASILFVLGILLGMPFPLGMRVAAKTAPKVTPWLWGINGAASVLTTVLATAVALTYGISASFWIGTTCYVVALFAYFLASRKPEAAAA